jgi:hypothetical protein
VEWWFCFVLREGENEMKTDAIIFHLGMSIAIQ